MCGILAVINASSAVNAAELRKRIILLSQRCVLRSTLARVRSLFRPFFATVAPGGRWSP
jgi:hypothetical protein